jgi:adenosylmethionine-8-amino-7-oxononanoate aminotransferase
MKKHPAGSPAPAAPNVPVGGRASAAAPAWLDADRRHVWHPYTQMQTAPPPLPVVRAEGVYLHLADGRRVLDGISSWWVNIHGHNHPRLNRALAAQAERLAQVIFAGFTHEPAARLAAALAARVPGRLPWVFYSDDGSTAVEVALKMAYQHWRHRGEPQRTLFVAFDDAYHGDTFGAMAAGGVAAFHSAFSGLFCAVRRACTPGSAARGSPSPPLAEILDREGERVAAVILEPMLQGAGGMLVQTPEFLRQVRALTARHGVPLIADEVLTGFGRTGRLFACEHGPIEPDLLCLSKALTGGYLPLAATLASEPIYRAFLSQDRSRTLFHGHSYTANALACAVALESLALFEEEDRLGRIARLAVLYAARLAPLAAHPVVAAVRHLGGMAALDLKPTPGDAGSSSPSGGAAGGYLDDVGPLLARRLLDRGLLLRPLGNVLYLLPPYVIADAEVEAAFDAIAAVLDEL